MFGSHVLWNDLLTTGLVDELHLMIGSAFLGGGTGIQRRAHPPAAVVDVRRLDDLQLILAMYAAAGW